MRLMVLMLAALCAAGLHAQTLTPVPIVNGSFDGGLGDKGLPKGWGQYAGSAQATVTVPPEGRCFIIDDNDPAAEIGLVQQFPLKGGLGYEVSAQVRAFTGRSTGGAYLQFRFLPSNKYEQTDLSTEVTEGFEEITLRGYAPPDTTAAMIYLYSHRDPTPKVMVTNVKVVSGVPPPPPPDPVPPVYDKLRDLHPLIALAADGKPACAIVSSARYTQAAELLQQAIREHSGVTVPIVQDTDTAAATPFTTNLIVLGNRCTNRTSSELYDRYYSLMDLKYPGAGGYAVRTLHNPYGNGFSAVLVGGSDGEGVLAGAQAFAQSLAAKPRTPGSLAVGWTMLTKLGAGLTVPTDIKQFETWEASKGYGSVGYFGWCSISKRMAMYYMTGDEFHAREALRLSFPDAQAIREMEDVDGERIENKHDPLAGPYHYNAMMLILYWDLIEESPVFSDAERLKVTNAFARRLKHPQDLGTYSLNSVPSAVGSRHGQWSALSLYTLGRYFNKYYPSDLWAHAERAGQLHFASLHKHAWLTGEADNLFWYNTGMAPILTYMILSGDRKPLENGVLGQLLRGQEVLISGRIPDWALNSAALDFLNKAAYLTGDGRWLTYLQRTGMDTNLFRLGQSFWPDASLKPALPTDLCGRWTFNMMPKPMWQGRGNNFTLEQSFLNGSYRSAPDSGGDYVLLDGYHGASRNPYHTYDILELRLNGRTLLAGYQNQVLTSADGMVEPSVPMDGALLYQGVLGPVAVAVGQVPNMPFANWRRTLAQSTGRYSLIVDDLTFKADSENMKVNTMWQPVSGAWNAKEQALRMQAPGSAVNLPGWVSYRAIGQACTSNPAGGDKLVPLEGDLNIMLLRGTKAGEYLEMPFRLTARLKGEAFADLVNYTDRGMVRFYLDGKPAGDSYDHWSDAVQAARAPLGPVDLPAGEHVLRAEAVGPHPGGDKLFIGLGGLSIKTPQAAATEGGSYFELRGSDVQETTGGSVVNMNWNGAVKQGAHRRVFYLLAQNVDNSPRPLACVQLSDSAAALGLPEPALAVCGNYQDFSADLAVLAGDHLLGHNLTKSPLLQADKPLNLYWDFVAGTLSVTAPEPTAMQLQATGARVQLDGKAVQVQQQEGRLTLTVPQGSHELSGVKPAAAAEVERLLTEALAQGQKQRAETLAALAGAKQPELPSWTPTLMADIGAKVTRMVTVNGSQGPLLAVADEKVVHLLTPAGQPVRRLETEGKILSLHWWDKPKLLLVGCQDEKLIAFDEAGQRKWVFTSEMDPAVYEAAKTYWFKSAPGHEGVRGLSSGRFLNDEEQCFLGGACTLEIVDAQGKLVKRLPAFWGCGSVFQLIPCADGSTDLVIAREPTDGHFCWVLNNKTMRMRQAFHTVPSGHTYVSGWANMSRDHLFHVDLNGDGKKEIVSEINGAWNRVTVWDEAGNALYNAQFGPGDPIPTRNMRDLDLADLNGDGKPEIIAATSGGLVVALDGQCRKVWSTRLPSAATVLKAVAGTPQRPPVIVVGCENGAVLGLDAAGKIVRQAKLASAPTRIEQVETVNGPLVVLGTAKGELAGFTP